MTTLTNQQVKYLLDVSRDLQTSNYNRYWGLVKDYISSLTSLQNLKAFNSRVIFKRVSFIGLYHHFQLYQLPDLLEENVLR
jgi:hypothetical protein